MASQQYIKLAKTLPPRLTRFFARYPPPALLQGVSSSTPSESSTGTSTAPSADGVNQISQGVSQLSTSASTSPAEPNPFLPHRHPVTGRLHDPTFSLRRQAELVKLARQHGVEELLPFTTKGTEERIRRRAENGLRMKGTGVGQKVKGKEAERTMRARLEKRRQAMLEMPKMIQEWKQRGHGRGWKKWPK